MAAPNKPLVPLECLSKTVAFGTPTSDTFDQMGTVAEKV